MDKFSSIVRFFGRYKYIITLLIFGVIIVFLDENSILRRMEVANEARNTRDEIEKYRKDFEESTLRLNELDADSNSIERIAREKYLMKKPNEDVYVFEEDLVK
ncbi:MAG: septum formation initiator family protein [Bacteroidaceae bacterium]|nr:septum formation initiator family protein [Bacteroidaceae bacterium]